MQASEVFLAKLASRLKIPRSSYVPVRRNFAVFCVLRVLKNEYGLRRICRVHVPLVPDARDSALLMEGFAGHPGNEQRLCACVIDKGLCIQ
jgi:hypothetical protein